MLMDFYATFFSSARTMLPIVADRLLHMGVQGYGLSATVLFGLSPFFALSYLLFALTGAGDTVSTIIRATIRHTRTPDQMRG
jgi:hypothetical protein